MRDGKSGGTSSKESPKGRSRSPWFRPRASADPKTGSEAIHPDVWRSVGQADFRNPLPAGDPPPPPNRAAGPRAPHRVAGEGRSPPACRPKQAIRGPARCPAWPGGPELADIFQGHGCGERIAREGVAVEKGPPARIGAEKGRVDLLPRQGGGEREIAGGESLGQAEEVRRDSFGGADQHRAQASEGDEDPRPRSGGLQIPGRAGRHRRDEAGRRRRRMPAAPCTDGSRIKHAVCPAFVPPAGGAGRRAQAGTAIGRPHAGRPVPGRPGRKMGSAGKHQGRKQVVEKTAVAHRHRSERVFAVIALEPMPIDAALLRPAAQRRQGIERRV